MNVDEELHGSDYFHKFVFNRIEHRGGIDAKKIGKKFQSLCKDRLSPVTVDDDCYYYFASYEYTRFKTMVYRCVEDATRERKRAL